MIKQIGIFNIKYEIYQEQIKTNNTFIRLTEAFDVYLRVENLRIYLQVACKRGGEEDMCFIIHMCDLQK